MPSSLASPPTKKAHFLPMPLQAAPVSWSCLVAARAILVHHPNVVLRSPGFGAGLGSPHLRCHTPVSQLTWLSSFHLPKGHWIANDPLPSFSCPPTPSMNPRSHPHITMQLKWKQCSLAMLSPLSKGWCCNPSQFPAPCCHLPHSRPHSPCRPPSVEVPEQPRSSSQLLVHSVRCTLAPQQKADRASSRWRWGLPLSPVAVAGCPTYCCPLLPLPSFCIPGS